MSLNVAPDQSVYESFYSDPKQIDPKQIWLVKGVYTSELFRVCLDYSIWPESFYYY